MATTLDSTNCVAEGFSQVENTRSNGTCGTSLLVGLCGCHRTGLVPHTLCGRVFVSSFFPALLGTGLVLLALQTCSDVVQRFCFSNCCEDLNVEFSWTFSCLKFKHLGQRWDVASKTGACDAGIPYGHWFNPGCSSSDSAPC